MDKAGVQKLYEVKHNRPMTEGELDILKSLKVRDIIRIWENLSFAEKVMTLEEYTGKKVEEETEETVELSPVRKRILTDIKRVIEALERLGTIDKKDGFGLPKCTFKHLREDQKLRNYLDSVPGTCRLGRKEGLIFFKSRDLVLGKDDGEWVILMEKEIAELQPKKKVVREDEAGTEDKKEEKKPEPAAAPEAGQGRRMRGGSVRVPVNDAEIDALVDLLKQLKTDDEDMLNFGTLRKHSRVKELFATKFPKVLQAAKRNEKLTYDGEDLWPDKDDGVKISLV